MAVVPLAVTASIAHATFNKLPLVVEKVVEMKRLYWKKRNGARYLKWESGNHICAYPQAPKPWFDWPKGHIVPHNEFKFVSGKPPLCECLANVIICTSLQKPIFKMNVLQIFRGVLALSVLFWHSIGAYHTDFIPALNTPGRTAVWLFFGISGYVIAYGFIYAKYSFSARDIRIFYINRLLRIYPLFLVVSLLSFLMIFIKTGAPPIGIKEIPAQFFAMQFNQDYILSGVFWTLGIEMHFYLIAPLLCRVFLFPEKQFSKIITSFTLYFVALATYFYAIKVLGWSYDGRNIIANLPHFLAGMTGCLLTKDLKPNKTRAMVFAGIALLILMYSNYIYHVNPGIFWTLRGAVFIDVLIIAIIFLHGSYNFKDAKPSQIIRFLYYLGGLSYGIYAWHPLLLTFFKPMENFLLLLLTTGLVSAVAHRIIDLQSLALKRMMTAPSKNVSLS
jgi:peptidoglycan/LPS O-acetylase OafA/YrhL